MKRYFLSLCIASLLMLVAVSAQATETLTLDPQHTYILWHIKHFGFSTQAGKWYASGTLMIDKDRPQNSKVNVTVQVTNIVTGNAELDKHLKGKLFFDVEHFPTATFVSDQVKLIGKKAAKVHGILTLHGVSKPVVLDVKLNETGINPITEKMTAGFSAKTRIKRSDFNITTLLPSVSDEVNIDIEAEAYKPTN